MVINAVHPIIYAPTPIKPSYQSLYVSLVGLYVCHFHQLHDFLTRLLWYTSVCLSVHVAVGTIQCSHLPSLLTYLFSVRCDSKQTDRRTYTIITVSKIMKLMEMTDIQTNQKHRHTDRSILRPLTDRHGWVNASPRALHAHNGRLHCAVARYVLVRVNNVVVDESPLSRRIYWLLWTNDSRGIVDL